MERKKGPARKRILVKPLSENNEEALLKSKGI
jgi:hypothetical protein